MLVGLPGIPIVLLMATIREPARKELTSQTAEVSIRQTFRYVRKYWKAYGSQIVGTSFFVLSIYSIFSWVPTMFIRQFGWNQGQIGPWFGSVVLFAGTAGLLTVGTDLAQAHKVASLVERTAQMQLVALVVVIVVASSNSWAYMAGSTR